MLPGDDRAMDDFPQPEDLLPFYERELGLLRRSMRAFSERYPDAAARLGISGERSEDPHVERLLQSAALSNARAAARIDDNYSEMPAEMLERLHPEVLRPFPASAIAQIRPEPDPSRGPQTIARGTEFASYHGKYRFRSAYDVMLAPLSIGDLRYAAVARAPRQVVLPADTLGVLSVTFETPREPAGFKHVPDRVRIYLDGAPQIVAALSDACLLHAIGAFVELDDSGQWRALESVPVSAVGFGDADGLFPAPPEMAFPLRLLREYFAFPERFHFIDVDFRTTLAQAASAVPPAPATPVTSVTLHLAIAGVRHDSPVAQRLSAASADNLKLFCTPVVNLFQRDSEPVAAAELPGHPAPRYPVVPSGVTVAGTEVWSINEVWLNQESAANRELIEPLHAFGYRKYYGATMWATVRDARAAQENPGYGTALTLRKLDRSVVSVDPKQLLVKATYTNRNLPADMPIGAPEGDLEALDTDVKYPIVLLQQPTRSEWPKPGSECGWQLLTQMSPHVCRLDQLGLRALKALFRQFAAHARRQALHIDGITALRWRGIKLWTTAAGIGSFEPGIEITMTLDEQRFELECMNTFIGVMDRLFATYVDINSAIQLVAVSARTGSVIRKCAPRAGHLAIL